MLARTKKIAWIMIVLNFISVSSVSGGTRKTVQQLSAPRVLAVTATSGTASVEAFWTQVRGNNGYKVRIYQEAGKQFSSHNVSPNVRSLTIELQPNTNYRLTVQAVGDAINWSDSQESGKFSFLTNGTGVAPSMASVTISGSATVGSTLSAITNGLSGTPAPSLTYSWKSGTNSVGTNSSTYTVQSSDIGSTITVTVTASNGTSPDAYATSAPLSIPGVGPSIGSVTIDGYAVVGLTVIARANGVAGSPEPTISYQWSNGSDIDGATNASYVVTEADLGKSLTVRVTATNGTSASVSTSTSAVAASRTVAICTSSGLRSITGEACKIGDQGPGGGTIFLLPSTTGNTTGEFFEVASENADLRLLPMCSSWVAVSTGSDVGTGRSNTSNLLNVAECSTNNQTARVAINYAGGGLSDWYLGSVYEMRAVRLTPAVYLAYNNWAAATATSSGFGSNAYWFTLFDGSSCGFNAIGSPSCTTYRDSAATVVRPIRSFLPSIGDIIGFWDFNDASNLGRPSMGGIELTIQGNAAYTLNGVRNGGLLLDGAGSFLSANSFPSLPSGDSPYTIAAWIKPSTLFAGTGNGILGWGTYFSDNQVNALRLDGSSVLNYWWARDLMGGTVSMGTFAHVAATYDGVTRKIFVNGTLVASDTPNDHDATTDNFSIGKTYGAEYFNGVLDDVVIYKVALTATQINSLMTLGPTP